MIFPLLKVDIQRKKVIDFSDFGRIFVFFIEYLTPFTKQLRSFYVTLQEISVKMSHCKSYLSPYLVYFVDRDGEDGEDGEV